MKGEKPFLGLLGLHVKASYACPKSEWRKRHPRPTRWKGTKPDVDNILKAIMDAGTGIVWMDDAQIASVSLDRLFAAQGHAPSTEVTVMGLEPWTNASRV
jgi:Holliday junction resolvase RusA-like endonuclease